MVTAAAMMANNAQKMEALDFHGLWCELIICVWIGQEDGGYERPVTGFYGKCSTGCITLIDDGGEVE